MKNGDIWDLYFQWLLRKIGVEWETTNYRKLYLALYDTDFLIAHPRDENRGLDGLYLREKFVKETKVTKGLDEFLNVGPCSVLEMLVAFSIRIDAEWDGEPGNPDPGRVFFRMIKCCSLDKFRDRKWNGEKVNDILWKVMKKNDPKCMLFPVPRDLKLEFWEQAIHSL